MKILRVNFGPITACLIHIVTRCRGYRGACIGLPNPTFGKEICQHSNVIKLHKVQESAGSALGDISIHLGDQAAIQGVTGQTKMNNL